VSRVFADGNRVLAVHLFKSWLCTPFEGDCRRRKEPSFRTAAAAAIRVIAVMFGDIDLWP